MRLRPARAQPRLHLGNVGVTLEPEPLDLVCSHSATVHELAAPHHPSTTERLRDALGGVPVTEPRPGAECARLTDREYATHAPEPEPTGLAQHEPTAGVRAVTTMDATSSAPSVAAVPSR
jgi:hypothetical protein